MSLKLRKMGQGEISLPRSVSVKQGQFSEAATKVTKVSKVVKVINENSSPSKMAIRNNAVRNMFMQLRETFDAPTQQTKKLRKAVSANDFCLLKNLEWCGEVTKIDILKAAIDEEDEKVLEAFNNDLNHDDTLNLLDYSIEKRSTKNSRKFSANLKDLGERAIPLLEVAIIAQDVDFVNYLLDKVVDLSQLAISPLHLCTVHSTSTLMIRSLSLRLPSCSFTSYHYSRVLFKSLCSSTFPLELQ